ncbi:hypothetical protein SVI_3500 [Shewanella violacea DSS12]|uniref:Uncharacterized protein n=1 Tax=Shewanella violacea (strain JCM 10179 / CIP 106290 / LMG 19151 / DSS12) TaxID=637905 RepID=D4ZBS6_SHEVD|nr:hypothetical protein SVI_3500 [Shewanella violacea DSS12]
MLAKPVSSGFLSLAIHFNSPFFIQLFVQLFVQFC